MSDLLNEFPAVADAYLEAANNAHDPMRWKPSHAVVFEAARRVGFSALRRRDTGAGQRGFARHYKEVCKSWLRGERFKREVIDVQAKQEKLTDKEAFERRMIGRARIGDVRALLRG